MSKISIFISYHKADVEYLHQLRVHLKGLERSKDVTINSESELLAGESWDERIRTFIEEADIIITLISSDYIASEFIYNKELVAVLNNEDTFIVPIIVRQTDWLSIDWLRTRQVLPRNGKPISMFEDFDEAYYDIARTISNLIETIEIKKSQKTKGFQKEIKGELVSNKKNVFISHDHDDGDFAELLKLRLEKEGFNAWIDVERLKLGEDWREEIDVAIKNSIALIAIMSPEARQSEYVTYEWAYAWGKGVKILPIMLKKTQLHPRLESLQYIDFSIRNSRPWDKLLERLNEIKNSA
jgi:hypothetical protein